MTICDGYLTTIGSDNGLSPGRRQAIIWTNDGILLIRPLGTKFSEILIRIQTFSFKKLHLKTSSAKWGLFCLGLNELIYLKRHFNNSTSVHDGIMTWKLFPHYWPMWKGIHQLLTMEKSFVKWAPSDRFYLQISWSLEPPTYVFKVH